MSLSLNGLIAADLREAERLHRNLKGLLPRIAEAAAACAEALQRGGKIVVFGNGGSAADAQHIAAEFVGRFEKERMPLPALALTVNTSVLTAIGNDYDFGAIFERQVQALVRTEDVVIGLSTSGNSKNVVRGILAAKKIGAVTVGLTGRGGRIKDDAAIAIAVPSARTPRVQEIHILIGHAIAHAVEAAMPPDARVDPRKRRPS
ncbi:MAG: SIS domain-containing protein [Patescibacteria group bacterium]